MRLTMPDVRSIPFLAVVLAFSLAGTVQAQDAPEPARPAFLGFRAGAPVSEIADQVGRLGGEGLRCRRARRDRRVAECRATVMDPEAGSPLALWMSAIDSTAAILTVSGEVTGVQLDRWREGLERTYGPSGARIQGNQWMMQWIRQERMVRLTWRVRGLDKEASVSLVDGSVLDAWGAVANAALTGARSDAARP